MTGLEDLSGAWRAHVADGDLHQRFADHSFDDRDWTTLTVPGHWRSTPEFATTDGPVLYRREFGLEPPPASDAAMRRRFLVLDGVFYYADVWLDAEYLGLTEGYFAPHTFEITPEIAARGEHTLAIEVGCPRQDDRTAKRIITGVFSHWDNLDPAWNPGGIWRPVRVVETGPVRIAQLRVLCTEATAEHGRLRLDVTLDAGAPVDAPRAASLVATVTGPTPSNTVLAQAEREVTLATGDNHLTWIVDVDDPPRWWPRQLGDQPLCDVAVTVHLDGDASDRRAVRTAFREVRMQQWQLRVNGERLFVMGSNQGPTKMQLAEATPDELRRDVQLAIDANLDLLRIHAHVTRPELYDAADEAGLLLWQDFPLQWGYARGIRKTAVSQARAMVDELGHHPSIALWCAHNEPLALDMQPGEPLAPAKLARAAVSMFLPSWNKDVLDRSISHALRKADPTRPVDPHSGVLPGVGSLGTDAHFYFGWYHGKLDGLAPALRAMPRLARFVTEFGAQAVPGTAEFMHPERWPDLDWDELFEHHACQKRIFDQHAPPSHYATFDEWRDATQEYQAALIQLQVEDLRRLKYTPTGGFCHFCFADGHPSVTWSVLDHTRVPKRGYDALRDACRPVLPMLDPRTGAVHVVSELRAQLPGAEIEVMLDGRPRRFRGHVPADGLAYVGSVDARGAREVVVTLEHFDTGTVVNRYPPRLFEAPKGTAPA